MNYDMNVIQSLLTANKLALNVKKTKHILIGSKFKLYYPKYRITLQLKSITHHKKTLGLHVDDLNWRAHINATAKKISAALAIVKRVSATMPFF